jgi:two-component system, NtrC family, sensor kinase
VLVLTIISGPDKDRRFELPDNEPQLIGRSSEALPLSDQTISRRHAELTPDEGKWYLRDLNSANGTFLNGRRVIARTLLQEGDQIRAGNTLLVFGRERRDMGVRFGAENVDTHIETAVAASDDSMVMAVPDPTEAAAINLNVVYSMLELIGSTLRRNELLDKAMDLILDHFQADRAIILLEDEATQRLEPIIVRHRRQPVSTEDRQIAVSRTIVDYVVNRRLGVLSSNAMNDERFSTGDSVQRYGIRSALCTPIVFKETLFGVIYLDSKVANYTYTDDQLHLLTAIGLQVGMALANMRLYAERLARERLAAVGQTVANLSHSIKNIIQGLAGGAEVVDLGLRKHNLTLVGNGWEIVTRNLERIRQLTLNMLAFSKQRRPELEMTNIVQLLGEIVTLVQRQFDARKVALLTALDDDVPPVPVDPSGLHQAVLNLLNNALDAVPEEKGVVTLSCEFDDGRQAVRIMVADNGEGIDLESRQRVFVPFYSTKGLRGTGLGLAVTRKIIDEHGGEIGVESGPDQGTSFTILLPLKREPARSGDTAGPGGGASGPSNGEPDDIFLPDPDDESQTRPAWHGDAI